MENIAWFGLLLLFVACTSQEKAPERPNIILILADDLGYSDIGSYGGEISTPNLDQLAANGLRFTQFHNAARCCPSRAALLTGLYPHQAGIGDMVYRNRGGAYLTYLNDKNRTLAEVLKGAGYQTLMSGKWHVGHQPGQWPTDRGFDHFFGINIHVDSYWKVLKNCDVYLDGEIIIPAQENPQNPMHPDREFYTTDIFTDYALEFLQGAGEQADQPFFLYMAHNAPHFPLEAPDSLIEKYRGQYMNGWDPLRAEKMDRMIAMGLLEEGTPLSPPENVNWDSLSLADRENLDFRRAIYAAQVDRMDENIGRLVDFLKETDQLDNTVILFMSDNGCSSETGMMGMNFDKFTPDNYREWKRESGWSASQGQAWANVSNVPFKKYKKFTYEGGTRTPFIVHWPEKIKKGGGLVKAPAHLIDLMPTLCEVAGAQYPGQLPDSSEILPMQGTSLMPLIENGNYPARTLFWEHRGNRAIRKGPWKAVASHEEDWHLYRIEEDPTEMNDLASRFPDTLQALLAQYQQWADEVGVRKWPIEE